MSIPFPVGAVTRAVLPAIVLLSVAQPAIAEICVDVDLRFTGAEPSPALVRSLQRETTAIWGVYDVRVLWAAAADACPLVAGQFDAVVDDRRSPAAAAQVTLGRTHVVSLRAGRIPIQVHRGATGDLIALLRAEDVTRLTGHPVPFPDDIGRALGRVLAHEIGHVLLGANSHRPSGLMRARFLAQDLIALPTRPYYLLEDDVRRLREQACLLTAPAATCAIGPQTGQ
jgi:hypothetical protein